MRDGQPTDGTTNAMAFAAVSAALEGRDGALQLRLRVQPGARRSALLGVWPQRLRVAVAAPPVDGKANIAVIELAAALCQVPGRAVRLSHGQASRDKVVEIVADRASVEAALVAALADALRVQPETPTQLSWDAPDASLKPRRRA